MDNPYLIPSVHAKHFQVHFYRDGPVYQWASDILNKTWMKPCGPEIIAYIRSIPDLKKNLKLDRFMMEFSVGIIRELPILESIINEDVDGLHTLIADNIRCVAPLLKTKGFYLVDVSRLTQDQAIILWSYIDNDLECAIKLLNHIQFKKNSALAKRLYVEASGEIRLHMIKMQLVTDKGHIRKHVDLSVIPSFRQFGPHVYTCTKKTYMNHIPLNLSFSNRDDVKWLIQNIMRKAVMTSKYTDKYGISMKDGVLYFNHVSEILASIMDEESRNPYDMIAIDASLYYMTLNGMCKSVV
ncbi:hypothetical protein BGZ76_005126 [Entomortierella beljakovae]|nr:hypothetical protein BGZ76_005126 [Entomortierella beljakovae]